MFFKKYHLYLMKERHSTTLPKGAVFMYWGTARFGSDQIVIIFPTYHRLQDHVTVLHFLDQVKPYCIELWENQDEKK